MFKAIVCLFVFSLIPDEVLAADVTLQSIAEKVVTSEQYRVHKQRQHLCYPFDIEEEKAGWMLGVQHGVNYLRFLHYLSNQSLLALDDEAFLRCFDKEEFENAVFDGLYPEPRRQYTIQQLTEHIDQGVSQAVFQRVKQLADGGATAAQYLLGVFYQLGVDSIVFNRPDYRVDDLYFAKKQYLTAAQTGDVKAQYRLGELYFSYGHMLEDNFQAEKWLLLAADQGYNRAQARLGSLYLSDQKPGIKQDRAKAQHWLIKAVQNHVYVDLLPASFYSQYYRSSK